ncbi:hypothetical protein [Halomarina rubra]|uniref:PLAT domain-containing protein n=1 Tax=Halomarina rubra TaxID=2071873 RepID=A0ABD6B153_9EURY|nr:hypothetical protein [Halomarina rubra]
MVRALHALLVCCVLLAGCTSGVGDAPASAGSENDGYTVAPGERVSVSFAFEDVRELHAEGTNVSSWPGEWDAVTVEAASLSPSPSAGVDTLPPYHLWDTPTDVDATFAFTASESAPPGEYTFDVTAWDDGNHSHENGTTESVTIRVVGNESG